MTTYQAKNYSIMLWWFRFK